MSGPERRLSTEVAHALREATDAAHEAQDRMGSLMPRATAERPEGSQRGLSGLVTRLLWSAPAIPADQVRRACERLDLFERALAELSLLVDSPRLREIRRSATDWSDLVWKDDDTWIEVSAQVNAAANVVRELAMRVSRGLPID